MSGRLLFNDSGLIVITLGGYPSFDRNSYLVPEPGVRLNLAHLVYDEPPDTPPLWFINDLNNHGDTIGYTFGGGSACSSHLAAGSPRLTSMQAGARPPPRLPARVPARCEGDRGSCGAHARRRAHLPRRLDPRSRCAPRFRLSTGLHASRCRPVRPTKPRCLYSLRRAASTRPSSAAALTRVRPPGIITNESSKRGQIRPKNAGAAAVVSLAAPASSKAPLLADIVARTVRGSATSSSCQVSCQATPVRDACWRGQGLTTSSSRCAS